MIQKYIQKSQIKLCKNTFTTVFFLCLSSFLNIQSKQVCQEMPKIWLSKEERGIYLFYFGCCSQAFGQ